MRDDIRYLNDQVFPLSGRKALQWEEAVFSLQPPDVIPSDEEGPPSQGGSHREGSRRPGWEEQTNPGAGSAWCEWRLKIVFFRYTGPAPILQPLPILSAGILHAGSGSMRAGTDRRSG